MASRAMTRALGMAKARGGCRRRDGGIGRGRRTGRQRQGRGSVVHERGRIGRRWPLKTISVVAVVAMVTMVASIVVVVVVVVTQMMES